MQKKQKSPADYIQPLYINGLHGRLLRLPTPKGKKREIMYIQGHHSSLERTFGVAEFLNQYGDVTVPDLPGFGGMDSFYKIGEKPSLDNMADYLASLIKVRYRKSRFTLCGLSMGFLIITRMLQKYPQIARQVELLVSFAGLINKDDFNYRKKPVTYYTFRSLTWFFSLLLPAAILKYIIFRKPFIKLGYALFEPIFVRGKNSKIRDVSKEERQKRINFEVHLWQVNDIRTYMSIAHTMLLADLGGTHVDCEVMHVSIDGDRYFDNVKVEQHIRAIYKDFHLIKAKPLAHSPSIIATAKQAAGYVPPALRRILNKTP